MELIFVAIVLVLFVGGSAVSSGVGGEGERDLAQQKLYPPVPQHHM